MTNITDSLLMWMRSDPDYRTAYTALTEDDMSKTHPCPNPGYCRTHAEWGDLACPICQEEEQEAAYQYDEAEDVGDSVHLVLVIAGSLAVTFLSAVALFASARYFA